MNSSAKFILLHLACTVRRPNHWRFHTAGILREIARIEPHLGGMLSVFI